MDTTLGLLQAVEIGFAAIVLVIVAVFVVTFLVRAIKIVKEYERGVIFRLGRVRGRAKGPGLFILLPLVDRMVKVDLRTVTMDVPPQDIITRDNVPARVNAVVYFRVVDPNKSVIEVENHVLATSQISQTTLRSVLGQKDLDELLTNRERSEEHTSELQSRQYLVCRLLLEKKNVFSISSIFPLPLLLFFSPLHLPLLLLYSNPTSSLPSFPSIFFILLLYTYTYSYILVYIL